MGHFISDAAGLLRHRLDRAICHIVTAGSIFWNRARLSKSERGESIDSQQFALLWKDGIQWGGV